jgi:hypothetical protein
MRAGLKVAETLIPDLDDRTAMSAALDRLHGAATGTIRDIVASLTDRERARLAVFCYGRAHLNATGLTIAASCSLEHLVAAAHSATAGRTIFSQSRDRALLADKPHGRRTPISLAASARPRGIDIMPEPDQILA